MNKEIPPLNTERYIKLVGMKPEEWQNTTEYREYRAEVLRHCGLQPRKGWVTDSIPGNFMWGIDPIAAAQSVHCDTAFVNAMEEL